MCFWLRCLLLLSQNISILSSDTSLLWMRPSVFLLTQFFGALGFTQTQIDSGPVSLDVTLLCKQKWVSKGLRELIILVPPTYPTVSIHLSASTLHPCK